MTAAKPDHTLDALRQEIDAIDDAIVELLARRFAATDKVKATKSRDGSIAASPFRPAREASMLRRLIMRGGKAFEAEFLVRLWRVILSASIQSQAPVSLHLAAALAADIPARLLISQHFCGMDVAIHANPAEALDALHRCRGDLAVLATDSDWARAPVTAGPRRAQVIATLPAVAEALPPQLLIFGHAEPQESGDDETLVLLPPDASVPSHVLWRARSGALPVAAFPGFVDANSLPPGSLIAGRYPRPIRVIT